MHLAMARELACLETKSDDTEQSVSDSTGKKSQQFPKKKSILLGMMLSSLVMTHALFAQHVRIAVVSYYDGDDIHEKEDEGRRKGISSLNVQQMNTICEQNHRAYTDMYNYNRCIPS